MRRGAGCGCLSVPAIVLLRFFVAAVTVLAVIRFVRAGSFRLQGLEPIARETRPALFWGLVAGGLALAAWIAGTAWIPG